MPYRPRQRPSRPVRSSQPHRLSYAARLAIARRTSRKPVSRGPSAILAVVLVLIITGVTMASAGVIAAGGVATLTIAALDEGLPDVRAFRDISFSEPTRVLDRSGKQELARFWEVRRKVIKYEDIPAVVLDVTTAVEDDTFWENPGVDLEATVNAFAQAAGGGTDRGGASTITQQLVRARLLPKDVIEADNTQEGLYVRKAKELIQSFKLTQAFPGEDGKKAIITAYLNEIFYGQAYGIAAAADVYFGKGLDELTVSEAALLAAIPQQPVAYDLYKAAKKGKKDKKGKRPLVVPSCGSAPASDCIDPPVIVRRNFILNRLKAGKGHFTSLTDEQYNAALDQTIVLRPLKSRQWKAPHFVNALLPELSLILGDREPIQRGGYTVISTIDMRAQKLGERLIQGGAMVPNLAYSQFNKAINRLKLRRDRGWIRGYAIRTFATAH